MKQEKERIKNYLIIELEIEFKINFDIIIKEWFAINDLEIFQSDSSDSVEEFKLWYVLTYIFRSTCNGIYSTEFLIRDAHTLRTFEIDFLKNEHCYVEERAFSIHFSRNYSFDAIKIHRLLFKKNAIKSRSSEFYYDKFYIIIFYNYTFS